MTKNRNSKRYYWLKLNENFFEREEVKVIESMKNGKDYIIFYMKLLLKSIGTEGKLKFRDVIPYTPEMLSSITNTDIDTVKVAIDMFVDLGLMEIWDDGTLFMSETQNMIGSETGWAKKKRRQKKRAEVDVTKAELPVSYPYKLGNCEVVSQEQIILPNGKSRFVDEKRYGGNGKIVIAKSDGKCNGCQSMENTVIHHKNGYSNELEDLELLCTKCHGEKHRGGNCPPTVPLLSPNCPTEIEREIDIETDIDIDIDIDIEREEEMENTPNNLNNNFKEIAQLYQQVIGQPNGLTPDWIDSILKDFGFEWVKNAMLESEKRGKRNKSYVEAILRNWKTEGGMRLGGKFNGANREKHREDVDEYAGIGFSYEDLQEMQIGDDSDSGDVGEEDKSAGDV